MEDLPPELILEILANLDGFDLLNSCRVNRTYQRLCRDESVWRRLVYRKIGRVSKIYTWFYTYFIYQLDLLPYTIRIPYIGQNYIDQVTSLLDDYNISYEEREVEGNPYLITVLYGIIVPPVPQLLTLTYGQYEIIDQEENFLRSVTQVIANEDRNGRDIYDTDKYGNEVDGNVLLDLLKFIDPLTVTDAINEYFGDVDQDPYY